MIVHQPPAGSSDGTLTYSGIDGFTLDIGRRHWSANALAPKTVRNVMGPLWTGSVILLPASQPFCGGCTGSIVLNRTGIVLNPADASTSVIPHGPVDDLDPTYLWTASALLAVNTGTFTSGPDGTSLPGEAAVWDPATDLWTRLPDSPDGVASSPAIVWTGTSLLIWGTFSLVSGTGSPPPEQTGGLQLG
jgi:hypothetical protein